MARHCGGKNSLAPHSRVRVFRKGTLTPVFAPARSRRAVLGIAFSNPSCEGRSWLVTVVAEESARTALKCQRFPKSYSDPCFSLRGESIANHRIAKMGVVLRIKCRLELSFATKTLKVPYADLFLPLQSRERPLYQRELGKPSTQCSTLVAWEAELQGRSLDQSRARHSLAIPPQHIAGHMARRPNTENMIVRQRLASAPTHPDRAPTPSPDLPRP